ncbi:ImmA/IrrE family metallo-endopeptidase [Paracoccus tegillarcae]|nr:ImmA/IrrE family metallo-endopeptidase [Paracoccus tegillarcae]
MKTIRELFKKLPVSGEVLDAMRRFNLSPNVDGKARSVKDLAIKLGFDVRLCSMPKGRAGRLVPDPFAENGYCIEISEKQSRQSQRWTVLHEMGHFFLHVNRSDPFAFDKYLDRSSEAFYENLVEEREANQFAAVLLFGDGALHGASGIYGQNIEKLARHFGVSEKVVEIAMKQFGIA